MAKTDREAWHVQVQKTGGGGCANSSTFNNDGHEITSNLAGHFVVDHEIFWVHRAGVSRGGQARGQRQEILGHAGAPTECKGTVFDWESGLVWFG